MENESSAIVKPTEQEQRDNHAAIHSPQRIHCWAMADSACCNLPGPDVVKFWAGLSSRERTTGGAKCGASGSPVYRKIKFRHRGNADYQARLSADDLDAVLVARRVEDPRPRSPAAGRCGDRNPESGR